MNNKIIYGFFGALSGLLVPFFWLLWNIYSERQEWWRWWVSQEINKNTETYIVLSLISMIVMALFGILIGKRHDDLEAFSQSAETQNITLSQLASTDALTGLFNARHLHELLVIEMDNARLAPLTCILADIDHFKRINDEYGHPTGDKVLVHVAKILKKSTRRMDIVGRLGGEEFLMILPGLSKERAPMIAERIRENVQNENFLDSETTMSLTISLGVVTYPSDAIHSKEALIQAVDKALYEAKQSGRNKVVLWEMVRGKLGVDRAD